MSRRSPILDTLPRPVQGSPYQVVFVCTGNICRSPMADRLRVSSAGTGPWHEGQPMDPRTAAALRRAGYPDHPHVAHQISVPGLGQSDLIVALDRRHQQTLRSLGSNPDRLFLLRSFDPSAGAASDVPDPFYGDDAEFDARLAMIAEGCRGLVSELASFWRDLPSP